MQTPPSLLPPDVDAQLARAGKLRRALRQPLLVFSVLGAALFGLQALVSPTPPRAGPPASVPPRRIELDPSLAANLVARREAQLGGPASADERRAALDRWLEEEVLYQEALRMGLLEGDAVVRARMVQKMRFLLEDAAPVDEPDAPAIDAYYAEHQADFREPRRSSFRHVFVTRRADAKQTRAAADRVGALLASAPDQADPERHGDPFLSGYSMSSASADEIDARFGPGFAAELAGHEPGPGWVGPLASSYGLHWVKLERIIPARQRGLDEVRPELLRRMREARREAQVAQALARLRQRYEVVGAPAPARMLGAMGAQP